MLSRSCSLRLPTVGSVNLALLSLYFFPVWGREAIRTMMSPAGGLADGAHTVAAIYFRQLFDLGFNGLVLTSHALAGVKLVIAAAFVAYVIEFARAWATGREADRQTIDVVLILAVVGIVIGALPALALGEAQVIRLLCNANAAGRRRDHGHRGRTPRCRKISLRPYPESARSARLERRGWPGLGFVVREDRAP